MLRPDRKKKRSKLVILTDVFLTLLEVSKNYLNFFK